MKPFAKSLLPSSTAPDLDGPITGMWLVRASCLKSSYIPPTNGSSGPTTTMSIALSAAKVLSFSNSFTPIATFSPQASVPALPGAMNSFPHFLLCAIFHAKACSRPPLPNNNILISACPPLFCNVFFTVSCSVCLMIYFR